MKPKVSSYIKSQVPEFIRNDNPVFVKLLESYYDFMEQPENNGMWSPIGFLRAAIEQKDVDLATDVFKQYIKLQVLPDLPQNELDKIDANTLIKHIKELVSVKGTLESYQFAMQAIYDQNVTTQQMSDFIFRTSDNVYQKKTIIVVKNLSGASHDLMNLLGSSLVQQAPVAAAFIDSISKITHLGVDYYTCVLREDTVFGNFTVGGKVTGKFRETGQSVIVQIDNILGDVELETAGSLYKPGQQLNLIGGSGVNGQVLVDEVSPGGVDDCLIVKRGYGHAIGDNINFIATDGQGTDAIAEVTAIDGVDADLSPTLELESVTFRSPGDYYSVGDLVELITPGSNVRPILKVETITASPATVTITYGGTYSSVNVLWKDGASYYSLPCTVEKNTVTYVPIPDVVWGGTPTFYVGGQGASGSLVTTALDANASTYVGTVTTTVKGYNYAACPIVRFYADAGFTQPIDDKVTGGTFAYTHTVDGALGINTVAIGDTIRFKGIAAGTTVYFKIECTSGSGFVGTLKMGGKIATTSIYRRGALNESRGAAKSYNIATRLFGTTKINTSAVVDAEYRLKNVWIANTGTGYTAAVAMAGFDTTDTLFTVAYTAGGLITNNLINVGALVTGSGIQSDTYVASIDSETQFTLTKAATATATGVTLNFGGNIVTISGGKGADAVLEPLIVNDGVASVTITNGGTLYSADTTIQVFSNTGSGAVIRPIISGGVITGVTIVDCGEGYTNSDLILAKGTTGSGAQLAIVTADGMIRSIRVASGGHDYQSGATLSITGDGASATASLTINRGIITKVTMTNRGSGYTTAGTTINVLGVAAAISIATSPNGTIKEVDVVSGGTGYWDPTEVTPLTITVSAPTSPSLDAGGTGYTPGATFVSIVGDGSGATATANVRVSDGKVLSITVNNIGKNYTYADISITGSGTGAFGVARITNGAITEIAVVSGKLAKLNPMLNAAGGIEVVEIIDPGFGYVAPPTITISGGGGSSASLTAATVDVVKRQLTGFTLAPGSGYKYGTRIVVDGDGSGAVLTPVVNTGITRLNIVDGGEKYTSPKALVYEQENISAKIELQLRSVDAKVKKFYGRDGVGTFLKGDVIFVGVSAARAIKRGVVVKVEGTVANPIIHYYLQDSYPLNFATEDFIQCERSAGVYCTAGVGTGALIEAAYAGGEITALYITSAGTGYETNSTIEIVNMDGAGATGTIVVGNSTTPPVTMGVLSVTLTNGGTGYFNKTFTIIKEWDSGDTYATGEEVWYGEYQYQAVAGGIAGATPPTHTTGTVSDGTINWLYVGPKGVTGTVLIHSKTNLDSSEPAETVTGIIGSYTIADAGTGYVNPNIVIYDNPGDAEVDVNLVANAVSTIVVTKNGIYSSTVAPDVFIIGDGNGATAHAVLASDYSINNIVVDTPGSGYTWAIAYLADNTGRNSNVEVFAERPIASVTINNIGTGYNYTFLSVIGDGQDASLVANLAGFGSITTASVDTQGTRYTMYPDISVVDVSAIGAVSKVTMRNKGYGYTALPLAVMENNAGAAAVVAVSKTIGAIKGFNTTDFGFGYHEVPLVSFPLNLITTEMAYPFMLGELVYVAGYNYPDNDYTQGPHAYVKSIDLDRNLLELGGTTDNYNLIISSKGTNFEILTEHDENIVNEFSNYIGAGNIIVGETTKLQTKILWQNRAAGNITNASIGRFKAAFTKASGYLSNADIHLQDSYRYHDYAYKLSTGLSLKDYESTLKALVHPSGYKMFGDIKIEGYGDIKIDMPTTDTGDQISDVSYLLLFSLYASLYIGTYVGYLEQLIWLTVAEISPFVIRDLNNGTADLSAYTNKLRRGRVITQVCDFMNMTDPGTLSFLDATLNDTILSTTRVAKGSGYNPLTTTATVVTSTGSGAVLEPIVSGGEVVAVNVVYGGTGYAPTDTILIVGDGTLANYTLNLGDIPLAKMTRSTGSWITDGFADSCSRFTVNNHAMFVHRDAGHIATAADMYVSYEVLSPISNIFTAGTYTWAADLVTVTSASHGLYPNQAVVLTFTSGGLTMSIPVMVTVLNANQFSFAWTGSGTAGNVTIERSFGTRKFI